MQSKIAVRPLGHWNALLPRGLTWGPAAGHTSKHKRTDESAAGTQLSWRLTFSLLRGCRRNLTSRWGGGRCQALRLLSIHLLENAWKPQAQKRAAFLDVRATHPAALSLPRCGRALTMRNCCSIQAVPIHQKRVDRLLLTSTF